MEVIYQHCKSCETGRKKIDKMLSLIHVNILKKGKEVPLSKNNSITFQMYKYGNSNLVKNLLKWSNYVKK